MQEILLAVVTSTTVATVAGVAINAWLEAKKTKWSTRLDALKAAVALEGYAITCAHEVSDHRDASFYEGHAGAFMNRVPDLPELSVAAGLLKPKKSSVANRLIIFPQEVCQANQRVNFWWDVLGEQDLVRTEAVQQGSKIGLKSLVLAQDIRSAFGLPVRDLTFGESSSVRDFLEENQNNEER